MKIPAWAPVVIAVAVVSCTSGPGAVRRPDLKPVALPDVARLVNAPVREQLRQRYESLTSKVDNHSTSAADLGAAYGEMGRLLLAAEYVAESEPCFLNAQSLMPDDMRWAYYLGHVYRQLGDAPKSAAAFERARTLRPDDEATLVWLGQAYLDQGRTDDAQPLFTKALSINAQSGAALYGLGRVASAKHDYRAAANLLERALAIDPRASIVRYPLALAYRSLGEMDKAEAQLRQRGDVQVGLRDPLMEEAVEALETASAYERRAVRASSGDDWKTAVADWRKAIDLDPKDATLRAKFGVALSMTGDLAAAEEQFAAAIRLSPGLAEAHMGLGRIMASSGRAREALEQFATAVKVAPDDSQAHFELAEALRQNGRPQEAVSHYEQVLKSDPQMIEARFGYAMALVLLKRYPEARARLTEDAKRYPDHPEFAQALAHVK